MRLGVSALKKAGERMYGGKARLALIVPVKETRHGVIIWKVLHQPPITSPVEALRATLAATHRQPIR
jgi:hypothetical protein